MLARTAASNSLSRRRNPASPSAAKISGIEQPAASATSLSQSTKRRPSTSANFRPVSDFPEPIIPTSAI